MKSRRRFVDLDQRRIIGLTIDPESLAAIRRARLERLGHDKGGEYADPEKVNQEIEYANELFRRNRKWPVFNVTGKALEETASEIIKLMASRRLNPPELKMGVWGEQPHQRSAVAPLGQGNKRRREMARGTHCWYNGKILPVEEAKISLFTHALHYGTGAFEGIRAYKQSHGGGAVFRLVEHMERFEESAKIMGLKLKYDNAQLVQAVVDACKANKFEECYVRPILFIGDGPLGVNPGNEPPVDVAVLCWEWGSYLGDQGSVRR